MAKKDVIHRHDGILLRHYKNKSGSFVETWMDLETVIQNKVNQRKTNIVCYHICLESGKMVQMSLFAKQK